MERPPLELVANRFVIVDRDRLAIDLATGTTLLLRCTPGGTPDDQTRWAVRCDRLMRLRHRAIAPLVDYGIAGDGRRFEAWDCARRWTGSLQAGARVLELARQFLHACGWTVGTLSAERVHERRDQAVVLPDHAAGYDAGPPASSPFGTLEACGLQTVGRRAVATIADVIMESAGGSRVVALWGQQGAGISTAVVELSRVARLHGLVPLGLDVVRPELLELVEGRSLFLIGRSAPEAGWRALVDRSLRSSRANVLLFVGADEPPHVDGTALDRLSPEVLVASIRPDAVTPDLTRRITAAAERANGLPGRFARMLWGVAPWRRTGPEPRAVPMAAERQGHYTAGGLSGRPPDRAPSVPWPLPAELALLAERMTAAVRQIESGRRHPGERTLRKVVGALARRRDWTAAARGAVCLAASLLTRGRPQEAQAVLSDARRYAESAGEGRVTLDAAILAGAALIDLARFDEAASALRAAAAASRGLAEPVHLARSRLGLARWFFWRGLYLEAGDALRSLDADALPGPIAVRIGVARSRIAIGRRDLAEAASQAASAQEAAEGLADPSLLALTAHALAFVQLAIGDRSGIERHVAIAIRAARAAREPLRALKARLLAAESARRHGRLATAAALVGRLRGLRPAVLPHTVRARCALLSDLLTPRPPGDVLRHHIGATGLEALALFVPPATPARGEPPDTLDEMLEILRLCQSADEESGMLARLCARLRVRLRAAAIALVAPLEGRLITLAAEGGRAGSTMADRVMAAGQTLSPHRLEDGIEGGAPVRYGGDLVGALIGRWTLGATMDPARVAAILAMAATAAGPAAAAALARRSAPAPREVDELLGISAAMSEVRRAVERAAAAPFPVLVEGESGCGKELVARALHRRGARRERPFCTLNCAALPDDLVESELFGHARGAFTGAVAERAGVFEEAHTGTLFLDEIGELSPRAQAKILRTIQEGELRRVGDNVARRVDVRLVAATNRDLRQEAAAGRFRHDLLYRLDVIRITVPPLRDRAEDVAVLVEHFWREAARRVGTRATLASATIALLARHHWPGNVRELQNVLAALAVRTPRRGVVPPTALPPPIGTAPPAEGWRLDEARRSFEERFVRAALVRTGGHRARAAHELGLTRQGLAKLMTRLGIADS